MNKNTPRPLTEKVLEEKLSERFEEFDQVVDMKFQTWADVIIGKFRDEMKEVRSDIMIGIDKIMKRIDDIDANTAVLGKDVDELKTQVTDIRAEKN